MMRRIGQAKAGLAADYTAQLARNVGKVVFFAKHVDVMDEAEETFAKRGHQLRLDPRRPERQGAGRGHRVLHQRPRHLDRRLLAHRGRRRPQPAGRLQHGARRAVVDRRRADPGHRPDPPDRPVRAGHRVADHRRADHRLQDRRAHRQQGRPRRPGARRRRRGGARRSTSSSRRWSACSTRRWRPAAADRRLLPLGVAPAHVPAQRVRHRREHHEGGPGEGRPVRQRRAADRERAVRSCLRPTPVAGGWGRRRRAAARPRSRRPAPVRRAAVVAAGDARRPDWAETADVDVFHVQFGFDAWSPDGLRELGGRAAPARASRWSSPCTTCATPTTPTAASHDAQLDVLVPAADAVVTLTRGAAAEIAPAVGPSRRSSCRTRTSSSSTRWRRRRSRERAARTAPWSGRPAREEPARQHGPPTPCCPTLVEAVRRLPGARAAGQRAPRRARPTAARATTPGWPSYLRDAERRGDLELHVHDYLTDDELWDYLAGLDVSVLPYRFGTHSGWLEACRDLGTTVVAPDCGYFADQGPVLTYDASTRTASTPRRWWRPSARGPRRDPPPPVDRRRPTRASAAQVAAAHRELYRGAPVRPR